MYFRKAIQSKNALGQFIAYKNSKIHYCQYGNGDNILVCLHGFGKNASSFKFINKHIYDSYTVIAIDMPFHGETEWNEELLFTAEDLFEIFQLHNVIISKPITLLGYSIGGRVVLNFFQQYPALVETIILIAPDGLHSNKWYKFATQTYIGKYLFKFTMRYPQWLLGIVKFFDKKHILNKNVIKFVYHYLNNKSNRTTLYKRWITLRKCIPNLYTIKQLIAERDISVKMLFGKYDPFIRYKAAEKFQRGNESFVEVKVINADHQLLREKYAHELIGLLNR